MSRNIRKNLLSAFFIAAFLALALSVAICRLAWADGVESGKNGKNQPATRPQRPPTTAELERNAITKQLRSGDAEQVNQAIATIKDKLEGRLDYGPLTAFREQWGPALIEIKRYDDFDKLAVAAMLRQSDSAATLALLQLMRVRALSDAGSAEAALAAAKAYYNVCPLAKTSDAIALVSTALVHAHPDDGGLARRFRAQQAAGAATQPTTMPAELGAPILASITVDGSAFKDTIDNMESFDAKQMMAKANLLLVSGRSKEARDLMQQAYDAAEAPSEVSAATEGLARAMRAEDGSVGRANGWLVELRKKK